MERMVPVIDDLDTGGLGEDGADRGRDHLG